MKSAIDDFSSITVTAKAPDYIEWDVEPRLGWVKRLWWLLSPSYRARVRQTVSAIVGHHES